MRDILILQRKLQRLMIFENKHIMRNKQSQNCMTKIHKLTEDQGEVLDQTFQSDLLHIMQENSDNIRRHILKAVLLGCFGRNNLKLQ